MYITIFTIYFVTLGTDFIRCHGMVTSSLDVFEGLASLVAQLGKESACNVGDLGLIPELERCPGGGHGNPLQYSCLENPMDKGAWRGYSPWGCRVGHD